MDGLRRVRMMLGPRSIPSARLLTFIAPVPHDPFSDGLAILVVEDDSILREVVRECLLMDGYAVDAVSTIAEATTTLHARAPEVLVLDLQLEDSRAEPLLEAARALGNDAPITVLISAAHDAAEVARRYGVPFLPKPFDLEQLSEVVAREIGRRSGKPVAA